MKNPGASSESATMPTVGERVTVNLSVKARSSLQEITELTGHTKTDAINRALVVYAEIERMVAKGGAVFCREDRDGDLMQWKIL